MSQDRPRIVATVECRMTSSRLPGKVLMPACGKPFLEILVERLSRVRRLDAIVLATTANAADDPVAALGRRLGVGVFRGSEHDVLSRVLGAAGEAAADLVVEITADCPLLDPEITAQVIDLYLLNDCDYASNVDPVSFPVGMDAQVFSRELLALADREGTSPEDREHVSWFIRRQPERFRKLHLPAPPALRRPELGLTLDEADDYRLLAAVAEALYPANPAFSCADILALLDARPELAAINRHVARKEV